MKSILIFVFLFLQFLNCYCQEWITYTSPDNSFKIKSPGQTDMMTLNVGYGIDSTEIYTFKDETNSNAYQLTINFLSNEILKPESNEEERFEILKRYSELTIAMVGKILHSEKIFLSDYPGIYLEGQITQGARSPYPPTFVKAYLVGNRMYQLLFSCSPEDKESKLKDDFFDSFELIGIPNID